MKNLAILFILAISILSCKKKESDNPSYIIEGTLYDDTGKNVVAGSTLALSVVGRPGLTRSPDNDFYQTTTTNANGRFSFTCKELDVNSASKLMLAFASDFSPTSGGVFGTILKDIPINENIDRDVCANCDSKVELLIRLSLNESDTIYCSANGSTKIFHPFKDTLLSSIWERSFETMAYGFRWAVGREEFNKFDSLQRTGAINSNEYKKHNFNIEIRGFPYVETIVLE